MCVYFSMSAILNSALFLIHGLIKSLTRSPGSCRTSAGSDQRSSSSSSHGGSDGSNGKKVEVIDLTLDSSSDDEGQDSPPPPQPPLPPPPKRACPSMSPTSPPVINKGSDTQADAVNSVCNSSNVEMRLIS